MLAQCGTVVGTRLHASILAKSYGAAIIGIDWTSKVAGFYKMLGLERYCFAYKTVSPADLLGSLRCLQAETCTQSSDIELQKQRLLLLPDYVACSAQHVQCPSR